jgi:hypothetical protein
MMRESNPNSIPRQTNNSEKTAQLLARLRQDQLEAALAGRIAESALYATEAKLLREELRKKAKSEYAAGA